MRSLSRIMATMAALGITSPDMPRFRVSKHHYNTRKNPGRKRLRMARGAGSINAKADILQLCRNGQWAAAANMDQEHEYQTGEVLFGPETRERWREYEVEKAILG